VCTDRAAEPLVLRDSAAAVWEAFAEGATAAGAAGALATRFGLDAVDARDAIAGVVDELCAVGALVAVS
jgi:hypothetical protein